MNPECVFFADSTLLEGPCWDPKTSRVYCVSIEQCLIYAYDILSGEIHTYTTNGQVGCVAIDASGFMISAEYEGIYKTSPTTGTRTLLAPPHHGPEMRYNDGKLDPAGRFLVGTKGLLKDFPGKGELISFHENKTQTLIKGTTISNGLGFSLAGDLMYFIDTPTQKVGRYFYDITTGNAVFDRYIVELSGNAFPDGMCVDSDDMIWVAEWGGGKVCKWNPYTGEKLNEIKLPCSNVTSCCIGGNDLSLLFITTAKNPNKHEPLAGGLFHVNIRK